MKKTVRRHEHELSGLASPAYFISAHDGLYYSVQATFEIVDVPCYVTGINLIIVV